MGPLALVGRAGFPGLDPEKAADTSNPFSTAASSLILSPPAKRPFPHPFPLPSPLFVLSTPYPPFLVASWSQFRQFGPNRSTGRSRGGNQRPPCELFFGLKEEGGKGWKARDKADKGQGKRQHGRRVVPIRQVLFRSERTDYREITGGKAQSTLFLSH